MMHLGNGDMENRTLLNLSDMRCAYKLNVSHFCLYTPLSGLKQTKLSKYAARLLLTMCFSPLYSLIAEEHFDRKSKQIITTQHPP